MDFLRTFETIKSMQEVITGIFCTDNVNLSGGLTA
jgi:hypothetical protein